jgi:poly-beta-1,6-N-acetyl-D-glucosamine synthase
VSFVAFVGALVVFYTYVVYPLLVAVWARFAPSPIFGGDDFEPTVSVCLTVYNGEAHIADKLRNLQRLEYPENKIELLVFSDGSSDATLRIVREIAATEPRLRVLSSSERLGKPNALNRLLRLASGEVLLLCDVRQRIDRRALRALLRPLSDPRVGCVSGSLVLTGPSGAGAYWRYERLIRGFEGRLGRMVGVSGSLYVIRRADMAEIPGDVLLDDMFVPLRVALQTKKRIVLAESAEAYESACDDEREFHRKVRTLAGNYQLLAKMPRLLLPHLSPVWFQMVSHKIMRLVCPWSLLAVFAASGSLALGAPTKPFDPSIWRILFCAQCAFYALSALGTAAGKFGTLARTFVVLNAAAVVGLFRFLRGSQAITW